GTEVFVKNMVQVKNAAGNFVPPKSANAAKALAAGTLDADGVFTPKYDAPDPDAYPLVLVTDLLAPLNKADPATMNRIGTFLQTPIAHPEQAADLDYAPLTGALADRTKAVIAQLKAAAAAAGGTTSTTATTTSGTTGSPGSPGTSGTPGTSTIG